MGKISLKANFDHKRGYFLWQVVAGVVSTNGYWCCSSKSLIKSIALWSGFCEVKTPWSMSYAVRNVQEPTSSRDSLMCLWPPDPKPRTFTLKALLAVFTLASLKFFTSKARHTLCACVQYWGIIQSDSMYYYGMVYQASNGKGLVLDSYCWWSCGVHSRHIHIASWKNTRITGNHLFLLFRSLLGCTTQ